MKKMMKYITMLGVAFFLVGCSEHTINLEQLNLKNITISTRKVNFVEQEYIAIDHVIHFDDVLLEDIEDDLELKIIYPEQLANEINYSIRIVEVKEMLKKENSYKMTELLLNVEDVETVQKIVSNISSFQIQLFHKDKLIDSGEIKVINY